MTYGTSHFVSRAAAIRYYRDYEGSDAPAAVARKVREGEIHIGKPRLKAGERLTTVDGGKRYAITEAAHPVSSTHPTKRNPTKAQKREKARKASVQRRVAVALAKYLKQQNPGTKLAGAKVEKLKGGVLKITPIKANAGGLKRVVSEYGHQRRGGTPRLAAIRRAIRSTRSNPKRRRK